VGGDELSLGPLPGADLGAEVAELAQVGATSAASGAVSGWRRPAIWSARASAQASYSSSVICEADFGGATMKQVAGGGLGESVMC
jgi:hypothetical protein